MRRRRHERGAQSTPPPSPGRICSQYRQRPVARARLNDLARRGLAILCARGFLVHWCAARARHRPPEYRASPRQTGMRRRRGPASLADACERRSSLACAIDVRPADWPLRGAFRDIVESCRSLIAPRDRPATTRAGRAPHERERSIGQAVAGGVHEQRPGAGIRRRTPEQVLSAGRRNGRRGSSVAPT